MKNLMKCAAVFVMLFVSFVGFAEDKASSNSVDGMWQWTNASVDYPVYFDFKSDGNVQKYNIKPEGLDVDSYKWIIDGSTIYIIYENRTSASKSQIVKNDGSSMILRDESKKIDMKLEKIK